MIGGTTSKFRSFPGPAFFSGPVSRSNGGDVNFRPHALQVSLPGFVSGSGTLRDKLRTHGFVFGINFHS